MPDHPGRPRPTHCVFCGIIDGREPALFFRHGERRFIDSRGGQPSTPWSDTQPDVFVFENQFLFFDLTSLVIPRQHSLSPDANFHAQQVALWRDLGHVGRTARDHAYEWLAWQHDLKPETAPHGFRIFCNFGPMGEQSQPHAHLQVHAGRNLDPSRIAPTGQPWLDAVRQHASPIKHQTDHTTFYDINPILQAGHANLWQVTVQVGFSAPARTLPKIALLAAPKDQRTQHELWQDPGPVARDTVDLAETLSPHGYRLLSNFPGHQQESGYGPAHILLLGGNYLGLYADYF